MPYNILAVELGGAGHESGLLAVPVLASSARCGYLGYCWNHNSLELWELKNVKHMAFFFFLFSFSIFLFGHYGGKKKRQEGRPIMTLKIWKRSRSIGRIFLGADQHFYDFYLCLFGGWEQR